MDNHALKEQFTTKPAAFYAKWLWACAILFAVRVVAQMVALFYQPTFLPPFESWHGGVLPYPILLTIQMLILGWLIWVSWRFSKSSLSPNKRKGKVVGVLAFVYFVIMLTRLILGLTILSEQRWFASYLPAFFHLVLASFLMLYGHFHFFHHDHSQS